MVRVYNSTIQYDVSVDLARSCENIRLANNKDDISTGRKYLFGLILSRDGSLTFSFSFYKMFKFHSEITFFNNNFNLKSRLYNYELNQLLFGPPQH